jgi:hypothetical protein
LSVLEGTTMTITHPDIRNEFLVETSNISNIEFAVADATFVRVTPDIARAWVELRVNENTKPHGPTVEKIAADLYAGNYDVANQALGFAYDSTLVDGLNRLAAIIKTGISIDTWVITGVQKKSREVLDTGASFKLKDALDFRGIKNSGSIAASLKSIEAWERGDHTDSPASGASTNRSGLAFLEAHPEVSDIARDAAKLSVAVPLFTTRTIASLIWAFDKLDRAERVVFFKHLVSGHDLEEGNFVLQLRNKLAFEAMKPKPIGNRTVAALTIKAWNQFREPTGTRELVFRAGGAKPETFPIPR